MKAYLKFDLSDHDDSRAHARAVKADDAFRCLTAMDERLREAVKYGPESEGLVAEPLRAFLREEMISRGILLEDLW